LDLLHAGTPICGDLYETHIENQNEYTAFINGQHSRITARGSWDPAAVYECGSFTIYYHNFVGVDGTPAGGGFTDPDFGEARESYYRSKCSALADHMVLKTLEYTTLTHTPSAIQSVIAGFETPEYHYLLADMHSMAGNDAMAQFKLSRVPFQFNLDARQLEEFNDIAGLYNIRALLVADSTLSPMQLTNLEAIAQKNNRAAQQAALVLSEYQGWTLLETLVEPTDETPKSNRSNKPQGINQKQTRVYPNPTSGILLVEVPAVKADVILHVLNNSGRSVLHVDGSSGINHLNIRLIAPGH
jgi:hypothetical protein